MEISRFVGFIQFWRAFTAANSLQDPVNTRRDKMLSTRDRLICTLIRSTDVEVFASLVGGYFTRMEVYCATSAGNTSVVLLNCWPSNLLSESGPPRSTQLRVLPISVPTHSDRSPSQGRCECQRAMRKKSCRLDRVAGRTAGGRHGCSPIP